MIYKLTHRVRSAFSIGDEGARNDAEIGFLGGAKSPPPHEIWSLGRGAVAPPAKPFLVCFWCFLNLIERVWKQKLLFTLKTNKLRASLLVLYSEFNDYTLQVLTTTTEAEIACDFRTSGSKSD